jgi:hypothetical protein
MRVALWTQSELWAVCHPGDQSGGVGSAEAVVDVDDGDVRGAGVEHAEEGGGTGEAGSVTNGGGDGDDGDGDQAADDGGKRAFHAGADDDGVGLGELGADGEEAMNAGDAYVIEAGDGAAEELGGDGGLFGDGEVAGAGAEDGDVAAEFGWWRLAQGDGVGGRVVDGGGGLREDVFRGGGVGAGGEDVNAGGSHAGEDFGGLGGCFSGRVDDFGEAGPEGAVVVDASVAEVFEGEVGETSGCGLGGEGSAFYFGQEF